MPALRKPDPDREALIEDTVKSCEGLSTAEISELLGIERTTVNRSLVRAITRGVLRREAEIVVSESGHSVRLFRYFKGDGKPQPLPPRHRRRRRGGDNGQPAATDAGWQARYEEVLHRLKQLEEWRRVAIERHPDLTVPDVVIQARRIAAKANPDFADSLLSGAKDDSPIMRAVLAAIEEMSD